MAMSTMFDPWDDPALQFTDEQLKGCDPRLAASSRANRLIELVPVVMRRAQLGELPVWWTEVAKRMTAMAVYYLWKIEAPKLDVEALNQLVNVDQAELKTLTLAARKLCGAPVGGVSGEQMFIDAWRAEIVGALQGHVTLGRRCVASRGVSTWTKADASLSNKVAYAMVKELNQVDRTEIALHAFQVGSAV